MTDRWLVSRALLLAVGIAGLLAISGPPAFAQGCNSDSDCSGQQLCSLGSCVSSACNADTECTNRRPFCVLGFCRAASTCSVDADCVGRIGGRGCVDGVCSSVECVSDDNCAGGRSCVGHQCVDCVSDGQCGAFGVCRDNACQCVECRFGDQCAFDQRCAQNTCVDFCDAGRVFVSANDGNADCKACVNPNTAQRCNEFPGCLEFQGMICAQGFCIRRCTLDPPDFDGIVDGFRNIRYRLDPNGLPNCPVCRAVFDLAPVRTALERAGVSQPVTVRLLHPSGRVLADLATAKPNRGSWASVPLRVQPRLQGPFAKEGGCGYFIEFRTASPSVKTARGPVCLRPR